MKKTMDANQIKLLAILAMTIDHIAWLVFPGYSKAPLALLMHLIGRMTCPIMCFFIAEGYYHTRNIHKYTFRLFLFASFRISRIASHPTTLWTPVRSSRSISGAF